jgi:geranylgeranyl diphosphate synthase type I
MTWLARPQRAEYVAGHRDTIIVTQGQSDFELWADGIRRDVDGVLETFFEAKLAEGKRLSSRATELVEEVRNLTMRGGKRLRPIVTAAAFRAVTDSPNVQETLEVGAALELLQTYLLIHDDWMDQDKERRGGPAVHFSFEQAHRDAHLGASLGILAGDLACTYGWELFLNGLFPAARRDEGLRRFVRIQKEVFAGQQLDLMADENVERMHELKTGSYTTEGPAALGGLLANASPPALDALERWATPLGVAFQLRDDLLSTFKTSHETGKPGDDLRHGKHNAVVAAFHALDATAEAKEAIQRVWGRPEAAEAEVEQARNALEDSGVRAAVESRLDDLVAASNAALASGPFTEDGKAVLAEVTLRLTHRGM